MTGDTDADVLTGDADLTGDTDELFLVPALGSRQADSIGEVGVLNKYSLGYVKE